MEKITWNDLPEELRSRKVVNWSELPENFSLDGLPDDVTITALTGEAAEESQRRLRAATEIIGARAQAMGLTEEKLQQLLDEDKEERLAELAAGNQTSNERV